MKVVYNLQIQDITSKLNKISENVVLKSNSIETKALIEEYNELVFNLRHLALTIYINSSRNKLTKIRVQKFTRVIQLEVTF